MNSYNKLKSKLIIKMTNLLKKLFALIAFLAMITSVSYSQHDMKTESTDMKKYEPVGIKTDDGILYGKDYDATMPVVTFGDLMKNTEANNGQTILVKGNVTEVCQEMGCWMMMSDGTNSARVKTLHKFFLPKDIAGSNAIVIGTFKVAEISEDEARHYLEESKNPTMKPEDLKGPQKVYEIEALGIKILNPENSDPSQN